MDLSEAFGGGGGGGSGHGGGDRIGGGGALPGPKPSPMPTPGPKPSPMPTPGPKPDHRPMPGPVPGRPNWRWPPYGPATYIGYEYLLPPTYYDNTTTYVQQQPSLEKAVLENTVQTNYANMFLFIIVILLFISIGFLILKKK